MSRWEQRHQQQQNPQQQQEETLPPSLDEIINNQNNYYDTHNITSTTSEVCHNIPSLMTDSVRRRKRQYTSNNHTANTPPSNLLLTIGHRGASYHVPEHTIASYRLALELDVDYIEPDLVMTSDGHLIAIHSIDLNITTDVHTKFGSTHPPWFSPTANRSGYWSYNFTLNEIKQLRVKQRLSHDATSSSSYARSTLYDNLLTIPTLNEIVTTLYDWNVNILPLLYTNIAATTSNSTISSSTENYSYNDTLLRPTELQLYQSGIYIELKESEWIFNETGMDMVELLFRSIYNEVVQYNTRNTTTTNVWVNSILHGCLDEVKFNNYILPPIVLQSFNVHDLEKFHSFWIQNQPSIRINDVPTSSDTRIVPIPEPPYILLVDTPTCYDVEEFWFTIGSHYRSLLSGIGCNKQCLLSTTTNNNIVVEKAKEFGFVLHPWTERPEIDNIYHDNNDATTMNGTATNNHYFESAYDEIRYLQCHVGVQGIFSESVHLAVMASTIGCDDYNYDNGQQQPITGSNNGMIMKSCTDDTIGGTSTSSSSLSETVIIAIVSFCCGIVGTIFVLYAAYGRNFFVPEAQYKNGIRKEQRKVSEDDEDDVDVSPTLQQQQRREFRGRRHQYSIPTSNESGDFDDENYSSATNHIGNDIDTNFPESIGEEGRHAIT